MLDYQEVLGYSHFITLETFSLCSKDKQCDPAKHRIFKYRSQQGIKTQSGLNDQIGGKIGTHESLQVEGSQKSGFCLRLAPDLR